MRVATFVLGVVLLSAGGMSEAAETIPNPTAHRAAAVLADGVLAAPASPWLAGEGSPSSSVMLRARDGGMRSSLGAIGFVPTQNPGFLLRGYSAWGEPYASRAQQRFDPARIPLPANRTTEDHFLTGFIAAMLIAYQLRRKHKFLRPHQFNT